MERVKIVLDADVLIHFVKAECLSVLPEIFPEYDYVVLSTVYDELKSIRNQLDNQILFLGNIKKEMFNPSGLMRMEYAQLCSLFGRGESACMAYCRFTNNVIGSSNLKDIKEYCLEHKVVFLTTMDFLFYAFTRRIMTREQCLLFVETVIIKGSKLPSVDIEHYVPNVFL